MKNALILHGINGTSQSNWFPWLKLELEKEGFKVWAPDLPEAATPNREIWTDYIFKNWQFERDSVIIGHSAGAVEILWILEELSRKVITDKAILVAGFLNDLGWPELEKLFDKPFDFDKIKKSAQEFVIINSDNDPYVPEEEAYKLEKNLEGKLIIMRDQGHFNLEMGDKYLEFPELLDLI